MTKFGGSSHYDIFPPECIIVSPGQHRHDAVGVAGCIGFLNKPKEPGGLAPGAGAAEQAVGQGVGPVHRAQGLAGQDVAPAQRGQQQPVLKGALPEGRGGGGVQPHQLRAHALKLGVQLTEALVGCAPEGAYRLPGHVPRLQHGFPRQRVARLHGHAQGHPADFEEIPLPHPLDAAVQALHHVGTVRDAVLGADVHHLNATVGVMLAVQRPQVVKQAALLHQRRAHAHHVPLAGDGPKPRAHRVRLPHQPLGFLQQIFPRGRGPRALMAARQQRDAVIPLQRVHLLHHRAGRDVAFRRRPGEAAAAAHLDEGGKRRLEHAAPSFGMK